MVSWPLRKLILAATNVDYLYRTYMPLSIYFYAPGGIRTDDSRPIEVISFATT